MSASNSGAVCGINGITSLYAYSGILLFAIISIIGNIAVILAIVKYAVLRKPPVSLFGVLAALHLIISCIVIPVNIKITLQNRHICYDSFWWMFIIVCLTLATVLLITFDQYVRIYYLEEYKPSVKKLFAGLLGCYIVPFVFAFIEIDGVAGALVAIALFFLYVSAIICCYIAMLVTLRKRRSILNSDAREKCIDRQRKAATTLMIVILLYIVTHTAPLLYIVLVLLGKHSPRLYIISILAIAGNCALNPILYFHRMPTLRKYMLRLLGLERVTDKAKGNTEAEPNKDSRRPTQTQTQRPTEQQKNSNEKVYNGHQNVKRHNSAPPLRVRWETDV